MRFIEDGNLTGARQLVLGNYIVQKVMYNRRQQLLTVSYDLYDTVKVLIALGMFEDNRAVIQLFVWANYLFKILHRDWRARSSAQFLFIHFKVYFDCFCREYSILTYVMRSSVSCVTRPGAIQSIVAATGPVYC
jgi:hypothetical protein